MEKKLKESWSKMPMAATVVSDGNSRLYHTGSWRNQRPIIDKNVCTKCGLCWVYCPDMAIVPRDDGGYEVDLRYCKGCGVCAEECPVKAIKMVEEEEE